MSSNKKHLLSSINADCIAANQT